MPSCLLCQRTSGPFKPLTNGAAYHDSCYQDLARRNDELRSEQTSIGYQGERLYKQREDARSLTNGLKNLFRTTPVTWDSITREMEALKQRLHEVQRQRAEITRRLTPLFDYWTTYPPDWDLRRHQVNQRDGVCQSCGQASDLHVHHRVPVGRGGSHRLENLALLCDTCHRSSHGVDHFSNKPRRRKVTAFDRNLQLIQQAIDRGLVVEFDYRKYDGERSHRKVKPSELKMVGKSLCMGGWCYLRRTDRVFAVKRMKSVEIDD